MTRMMVRGLTKVFLRTANTRKGIPTDGIAALRHLTREVFRRSQAERPERGGGRFLTALNDVSFDVAPGEVLGIIGRNGAGKSTLLKIFGRVLHPTAGRVTIHGRAVSMLELGIGFAPELTVSQNIQIHGRLAGLSAREVSAAEAPILEMSGLAGAADQPLSECGGGASVQLGFAALICFGAEVILADEVLAIGDTAFRQMCEERVRAAGTSGKCVLFVSHDMAAIRRVCTRVIWIDRGRIVRDGPTEDVVSAYTADLLSGRSLPPLTEQGLAGSCRLLETRLLDAGRAQVGALQLTEPGYIDCLFSVLRSDVTVAVEIELWSRKRLVVAPASPPVSARTPTSFRAGIRIPEDLLNQQQYEARLRLRVNGISDGRPVSIVAAEESLSFSVMNPHPERSVWSDWPWKRPGLISPRLHWQVETTLKPDELAPLAQ